jgi:proliferating cell nuclear antigen
MSSATIRADRLSQFVDNALAVATEAKLRVGPDALETAAVDPANVAMIDQSLSADAFESYEFGGGVLGVDLERLDDVLGMADSGELVHLDLNEETRKLHIAVGQLDYTLALIGPDSIRNEPDVPGVLDRLTATLVHDARALQDAHKAAGLCSDHIAYGATIDDETFYASAEGDTDKMRYEWGREEMHEGSEANDAAHSLFSLDYLKDILKPINASTEVTVRIGHELPLLLDSQFADERGELRYMVAPRMESD